MIISNLLKKVYDRDEFLFRIGLFNFIIFILLFVPFLIDNREVLGINTWIKPMKFCLSIGIYTWTIAFYLDYLRPHSRWIKSISMVIGISMIIEILVILNQASRGVPSHFNFSTGIDAALYATMGVMIALNTIAIIALLILYLIQKPKLDYVYLTSLRIGLVLFLVASWIGGLMIGNEAHSVGIADGGPGLPFLNWSTEGGDLRVAHFFGLHALQIFPLLSIWIKSKFNLDIRSRLTVLLLITMAFSMFFTYTFIQAFQGQPFWVS